jgi:hypothetical protein
MGPIALPLYRHTNASCAKDNEGEFVAFGPCFRVSPDAPTENASRKRGMVTPATAVRREAIRMVSAVFPGNRVGACLGAEQAENAAR